MKKFVFRRVFSTILMLTLLFINFPAVPVSAAEVIEIDTNTGEIGDRITISGSGFFESETVTRGINICFGRNNPGSTINYDTEIYEIVKIDALDSDGTFSTYFTVPDKLTDGLVDEDVSSGIYYIYLTYYYSDFDPPSNGTGILEIISFTVIGGSITLSPTSGEVGSTVSIDGSSFADNDTLYITFDNVQVGTTASDSSGAFSSATITVPESTQGNHTIKVDDGVNTDVKTFSTTSSMTISPTSGFTGDTVTLTGKGYKASSTINISFGGSLITTTPATVTSSSAGSFSATFIVPVKASSPYAVTATDGTNSKTNNFTIGATATVLPNSGKIGITATISGKGFLSNTTIPVIFDNDVVVTATTDNNGRFTATFTIPAKPTGSYAIVVSDGSNIINTSFTILTKSSISPVTNSASPGLVGSEITVTGEGYQVNNTITVTYDGESVAVTNVMSNGTFSATFLAPASKGGEHIIIATDGTNSQQFTFYMETAAPPAPPPLKPKMGVKASASTYFDWEDVADDSGVTYTLQIATSQDFSADSIILTKEGLTQSEYTLPQKLESVSEDSPYYWHVKAVDNAGNESPWTGAGAFSVGFSFRMSQTLIYVLLGIGALFLGVFGFWLGRKTSYY